MFILFSSFMLVSYSSFLLKLFFKHLKIIVFVSWALGYLLPLTQWYPGYPLETIIGTMDNCPKVLSSTGIINGKLFC